MNLNIDIGYTLKTKYINEYYIIINKDKYIAVSADIEYICSCISVLLFNKVSISIIENKFNLIETKYNINSIITKPKLYKLNKTYLVPKYSYFPKTYDELSLLVEKLIRIRGNECSLNDVDVSRITNMSFLFNSSNFNGDISEWNVSNVVDMSYMFFESKFNGILDNWNVGNVTHIGNILFNSPLVNNKPKWY